jgi:hypothetical protein
LANHLPSLCGVGALRKQRSGDNADVVLIFAKQP